MKNFPSPSERGAVDGQRLSVLESAGARTPASSSWVVFLSS